MMPTRTDVTAAAARIEPYVRVTPTLALSDPPCVLKLEQLQVAGSFKARGAFNNLLSAAVPAAGVAAASGGNHGLAVATAARALGHPCHIFVPTISAPAKRARIAATGATVTVAGERYADALALCADHQAKTGAIGVHAYASEATIAGQGTLAREWELSGEPLDTVLVAVGGGGLISGIATWWETRVKVVAVEPEGSCALHAALKAGGPVDVAVDSVAADALGARAVGALDFDICKRFVADAVLVSDAAIVQAQRTLWERARLAVEPAGAAAFAALESGAYEQASGERVGVLLCGANLDLASLRDLH